MIFALLFVSISYFALRLLSSVVVTPITPVKEIKASLEDFFTLPAGQVRQVKLSPSGTCLSLIEEVEGNGENYLQILKMGDPPQSFLSLKIHGEKMAWLPGNPEALLYEDGGDIYRIDLENRRVLNLTPANPGPDADPRPSPDGERIVWRRASEAGGTEGLVWWVMRKDGSGARTLGISGEDLAWSPDGRSIISYERIGSALANRPNLYFLQMVQLDSGASESFAESKGEIRYIGWLNASQFFYVALHMNEDLSEVKGVIYLTNADDIARRETVGTLKSLNDPDRRYDFYLSRGNFRLAYLGSSGLEFFDLDARKIYRLRDLEEATCLEWMPGGGELLVADGNKIYRLKLEFEVQ